MAENVVKHGGRYYVTSGPNKDSCKNTSYTPGISMHCFPKDARLRRLWTQFVRRHRANFEPSEYSALCFAHFEPTCFQRKLSLGDEAADKTPCTLLKQRSVPNVDTVAPPTEDKLSYPDRDRRGERRHKAGKIQWQPLPHVIIHSDVIYYNYSSPYSEGSVFIINPIYDYAGS